MPTDEKPITAWNSDLLDLTRPCTVADTVKNSPDVLQDTRRKVCCIRTAVLRSLERLEKRESTRHGYVLESGQKRMEAFDARFAGTLVPVIGDLEPALTEDVRSMIEASRIQIEKVPYSAEDADGIVESLTNKLVRDCSNLLLRETRMDDPRIAGLMFLSEARPTGIHAHAILHDPFILEKPEFRSIIESPVRVSFALRSTY